MSDRTDMEETLMDRPLALIIGGTKGLGRGISIACLKRGITPVITGRSVADAMCDPALKGALFRTLDLADARSRRGFASTFRILGATEPVPVFSHVFWVAGVFLHKPLTDSTAEELDRMTAVHLTGPLEVLSTVHRMQKLARPLADDAGAPYHLVTVASTSSWKMREDESIYCALKAAKAHFARNFATELFRDLPGSKATLVHPGGIATPDFWNGSGRDISAYMDPDDLAETIVTLAERQRSPFAEHQIPRGPNGRPTVSRGARRPQRP